MTTRSLAVLFAGAIALAGAAFAVPASAAPLPPVSAVAALAQDSPHPASTSVAMTPACRRPSTTMVPAAHYGPRPYYAPAGTTARATAIPPAALLRARATAIMAARRCRVTRVYTGYGYRTVRRCW